MPETANERKERHKAIFLKMCRPGTVLFAVKYRNKNKRVIGAKFFVATNVNEIEDVTSYVATIAGRGWDNTEGIVRCSEPRNLVEALSNILHNNHIAYNYKSL